MSIKFTFTDHEAHLLLDALDHWQARLTAEQPASAAFRVAGVNVNRQITELRSRIALELGEE